MSTRISDIPDGVAGQATDKVLVARDGGINRTLPFPAFQTGKTSTTSPTNPIRAQYIAELVGLPYTGSATADSTVSEDAQNYGMVTGAIRSLMAPYNAQPVPGSVLTIGSKSYTFVENLTGPGQVYIYPGQAGNTWACLEYAINASQGTGNVGWYWVDEANPDVVAYGQAYEVSTGNGNPSPDIRYKMRLTSKQPGLGETIEVPMSFVGEGYIYFEWPGLYQQCYVVYDPNYNVNQGEWFQLPSSQTTYERYTFVETVVNPGEVKIGATGNDSMVNLTRAIMNSGGVPGTDYLPFEFGAHPLFELAQPFDPQDGYFFLQSKEANEDAYVSIDSSSYDCILHRYQDGGIISGPYGNYGYYPTRGVSPGLAPPGGFTGGGDPTTVTFSNGVVTQTYTFVAGVTSPYQIKMGNSWYEALNFLKDALNSDENSLGGPNDSWYLSEVSPISMVWQFGDSLISFAAKTAGEAGNDWSVSWGGVASPGTDPFASSASFSGGGAQTKLTFSDGTRTEEYRFVAGTPSVDGDISVGNIGTALSSLGLYLHYCINNIGQGGGNGYYYKSTRMCPLLGAAVGSYSSAKVSGLADVGGVAGNSYTVTANDENITILRQFSGGAPGTEGYPGQLLIVSNSQSNVYRLYQMDAEGSWWYSQLSADNTVWPVPDPVQ